MSVRNIDADLAASKLNELFHLHRYDDCVLFVNRLSPLALLHLLPYLPIDAYLSRLPYTIELFESLYAKVFIHDPEQFPDRTLQVLLFIISFFTEKSFLFLILINFISLRN